MTRAKRPRSFPVLIRSRYDYKLVQVNSFDYFIYKDDLIDPVYVQENETPNNISEVELAFNLYIKKAEYGFKHNYDLSKIIHNEDFAKYFL